MSVLQLGVSGCVTNACTNFCICLHFRVSDLLSGIKKEAEAGRLPANVASGMEELYWNYKNAVNE